MNRLWFSVVLLFPLLAGCDREEAAAPPNANVVPQSQAVTTYTVNSVPWNAAPTEPRYQGRTIAEWIDQYGDLDEEFRAQAIGALGQFVEAGHVDEVVPTLLLALGDKADAVRAAAAGQLATLSETQHVGQIATAFLDALEGESSFEVRHVLVTYLLRRNADAAARAIAAMAAYERSAYSAETGQPRHCGSYRTFAMFAASVFDSAGHESIPHLARAVVDIHEAALPMNNLALARLLASYVEGVKADDVDFDDPRPNVNSNPPIRFSSPRTYGGIIGSPRVQQETPPTILSPLSPKTLETLGGAVARLIESLGHDQARVRGAAAISLAAIPDVAGPAADTLIELATDGRQPDGVRLISIKALGHLKAKKAAKPLGMIARDENLNGEFRQAAVESLGRIGGDAAIEALTQVIHIASAARKWDESFNVAAVRVLGELKAAPERYVPVLLEAAISQDLLVFEKFGAIERHPSATSPEALRDAFRWSSPGLETIPSDGRFVIKQILRGLNPNELALARKLLKRESNSDRADRSDAAGRL
ncbi:MAG: HEAT repeat domain-containing protein, partial [Planctomycetes bacterium]|nr:HEAT repeat domain-containing protein [Planctomycetota bacterium]